MKEYKIGETFEHEGVKLQCIIRLSCTHCYFKGKQECKKIKCYDDSDFNNPILLNFIKLKEDK